MSIFNLNIHTIIILLSLGNFIAVIILLMYKRSSLKEQSYGNFIAGKTLQFIAWPFLSMRGEIPDLLSVYTGNSLLIAGFTLETLALTVLNKRIKKWEYIYASEAVAGIILFWIFAATPNLRVGNASFANMLLFLTASYALIKTADNSKLRFTMGIIYGLFAVFLAFRSWYGFFSRGEFALMTPGFIQSLTFIQLFIMLFTSGIGFLLMMKEQDDQLLTENEVKYRSLVERANEAIVIIRDERILFANKTMEDLLGITNEEILSLNIEDVIHPDDRSVVVETYRKRLKGEPVPRIYDFRLIGKYNREVWVTISAAKLTWEGSDAVMALLTDITERKNLEKEKEKIINDLQKALSEVKALSGLLPICSNCKKIRDDKGYWNQIEVYIRDHSEADFSHGLCPDCVTKLYPGLKGGKDSLKTGTI